MLTKEGCLGRRQFLWERLPEHIDWVLIGDRRHVQYFCNFRVNPVTFSADQSCLLLLQRSGEATLLADNFVRRTATETPFVDEEVIVPWYDHRHSVGNRDHALLKALQQCSSRWATGQGVIETEAVSHMIASVVAANVDFDRLPGADNTLGSLIRTLRRRKWPDEIEQLKLCMQACDAGHRAAFEVVRPGVTELDVYIAIQQAAEREAGCACVVYGDFRATNRKQYKAGGLPTRYELQSGDLFIVDYSVVLNGYRSDFTNTIAVGDPAEDQVRHFEACRDALLAAQSVVRAGVSGAEVYHAASEIFLQRGFPALSHHCGHGLGLEHPEPPVLVSESTDQLLENDVITLEPGLYVDGVGGMRFEHNYRVTNTGAEQLSHHILGLTSNG
ncbi:MAG: aminopeptidase P family protein [Planctomycetaceae bacterium]|nr:aminopeptidase P family protein [Planctomycetaceae bacterium]